MAVGEGKANTLLKRCQTRTLIYAVGTLWSTSLGAGGKSWGIPPFLYKPFGWVGGGWQRILISSREMLF